MKNEKGKKQRENEQTATEENFCCRLQSAVCRLEILELHDR